MAHTMSDQNIMTFWRPGSMWPDIYHVYPDANSQTTPAVPQQGQHARLTWNEPGSRAAAGQPYDPETSLRNPPVPNALSLPAAWGWISNSTNNLGGPFQPHHVTSPAPEAAPHQNVVGYEQPRATRFVVMNSGPLFISLPALPLLVSPLARVRTENFISSKPIKESEPNAKLILSAGDDIGARYRVEGNIGEGTYGSVYMARDRQSMKLVAVKTGRQSASLREQAEKEVRILQTIKINDPESKFRCLRMIDAFRFRGHVCIATDLHDRSLMDFMEDQADECDELMPMPLSHIRSIVRQLLGSVSFLHRLHIVHADIKLDNVILCNGESYRFRYNRAMPSVSAMRVPQIPPTRNVLCTTNVRLIDFGCAALVDEEANPQLRTAGIYWPPEALAGQPWSYPVDIWSIGCMMLEMFTGEVSFGIGSGLERLARMQCMLGPFDRNIVAGWQAAQTDRVFFREDGRVAFPNSDSTDATIRAVLSAKPLESVVSPTTDSTLQFLSLLQRMLRLDPSQRITAEQALAHPWFHAVLDSDEGVAAAELYRAARPHAEPYNHEVSYDMVSHDPRPTPEMDSSGRPVVYV